MAFEARCHFGPKGFVSGNPVRPEFVSSDLGSDGSGERRRWGAVFGGSQGPRHQCGDDGGRPAPGSGPPVRVTHQTGERDVETVRSAYQTRASTQEPFLRHGSADERSRSGVARRRDDDRGSQRPDDAIPRCMPRPTTINGGTPRFWQSGAADLPRNRRWARTVSSHSGPGDRRLTPSPMSPPRDRTHAPTRLEPSSIGRWRS